MDAADRRCRGFRFPLGREVERGGAEGAAVFFGEPVVGKDLPHESGTDRAIHLGEGVSDFIHITLGFKTRADDERFHLLRAYRWAAGPPAFGHKVGGTPLEDRVAAIVIGFACLEAEAGGDLAFGEATEFPEGNHADFLLDGLFLGEGDGLAGMVREYERAVLDLNVQVERNMHDHPLSCGGVDTPECGQDVYEIRAQDEEPNLTVRERTDSAGFMLVNVYIV